MNRSERIAFIVKTLVDSPGQTMSLGYFADRLDAAKSTISEDLALVKETLEQHGMGLVRTHAGAAGGVEYVPRPSPEAIAASLRELCTLLRAPDRVLAGGYLYMTDIIFSPVWSRRIGEMFAAAHADSPPHAVLTVETKGIPLALLTARALGVPCIIARREHRVTEGPAVTINYLSGSSRRIQSMTLGRRSLQRGARVLIIDDFMKAGGTAWGMAELVAEFEGRVAGIGVLVATAEPKKKMVDDYVSLLTLEEVDDVGRNVRIRPTGG